MRKIIASIGIAACMVVPLALQVGCSPQADGGSEAGDAATTGDAIVRMADWEDEYGYIIDSMAASAEVIDEDGSNRAHTHYQPMLTEATANYLQAYPDYYPQAEDTPGTAYCMSCRDSTGFEGVLEQYGVDAWNMSYNEMLAAIGTNEQFGCYMCHGNEPSVESVGSHNVRWNDLAETLVSQISATEASCGQCHTGMYNYISQGANIDWSNADGYRYGIDPVSIRDAFIEDGGVVAPDAETGALLFDVVYYDVEMFQEGMHDAMGMTCASCHMVETTDEAGNTFANHDASGSPLLNAEAMEYCVTCHNAQSGVETAEEMVAFVKAKQAEADELDAVALEKMAALREAIIAAKQDANADAAAIELAVQNYADAYAYERATYGYAPTAGAKVSHNTTKTFEYLNKAIELSEAGIAALA